MNMVHNPFTAFVICATITFVAGCGELSVPSSPPPDPKPAPVAKSADTEHGHEHHDHGAGPHAGTLADWGGGKYHVEFTVNHDQKTTTVYILGGDEKTVTPVKADNPLLSINDPRFQVELLPTPLEGEADGFASRFVGRHDSLGIRREFAGTISAVIDGTPYAGDFKEEPHDDHDHK